MAASRSHRSTAGNRLAKLLNQEDTAVEEFYETAYGGFKNEENDDEYVTMEDGEDIVDSDFSNADDEDEQASDHANDDDEQRKRKKPMKYKEPSKTESLKPPKPSKKLKTDKDTERELSRKDDADDDDDETSGAVDRSTGATSSDDLGNDE